MWNRRFAPWLLTTVLMLGSSGALAQVELGPSDDVEAALNALGPGDEAILADGMYTLSGRFGLAITGTADEPIVIRAADGATPHFHRPDASQNIWDLSVEHVIIRGLTFSGGSAGLRFESASDVTIEGCEIFETADVALRMNDGGQDYLRISILRNHIHDTHGTGEGMYLGCNDDGCRLGESLIEGNYVHHTNAGDVSQGDGIELKDGSYATVIRDNVIHDTNYPCILGYSTAGNGAENVVEGNVAWNCGDNGIQWEANATIRNNIVLGAGGAALASQPHQENGPDELTIVHNTLINDGDALAVRNPSGPVTVANNALYSMGRAFFANGDSGRITASGNAGQGSSSVGTLIGGDIGADFVGASFSGALPQDVRPTGGGVLGGAGDASHVTAIDFDGADRMGVADIGAYLLGGDGWTIAEGFKPMGEAMPLPDGGPSTTDGGSTARDGGSEPGRDGGSSDDGGSDEGDGCGCRTPGSGSAPASLVLLGLVVLGLRRRR